MELIYDQIAHFPVRLRSVSPVKHILYHPGMIWSLPFLSPCPPSGNCPGIRIQQNILLIKQQSLLRVIRPVNPVSILKFIDI